MRIIIYIAFYLFGYDVWLLPNVLIDNRKFLDSLNPIIGYYPRDDSIAEILFRICFFFLIVASCIYFYMNPEQLFYFYDMVKGFFGYIEQWGYDKLTSIHVCFVYYIILFFFILFYFLINF